MSNFPMGLRDYQKKFCRAIVDHFDIHGHKRILATLATGGGKSICFSFLAWYYVEKMGGRVLILADTDELVDQAVSKLHKSTSLFATVEKAEQRASMNSKVVVASIQTMWNRARIERFPIDHFALVVADEAHCSMASGWKMVLEYFNARILGVTATPGRADNQSLMNFYEKLAYEHSLFDLIREGYLAPITVQTLPIKVDLSAVKVSKSKQDGLGSDFSAKALDDTLTPYFDAIIDGIKEHAGTRTTLVFQPLVKTSMAFVQRCIERGIEARHVDGFSKNRKEILRDFHLGKFQLLSNSMMLTKGYDEPRIECIINLRLTKHNTLYQQMIGRGTRLYCPHGCHETHGYKQNGCTHENRKFDLLLLDLLYQFPKYAIMGAGNLLAKSPAEAQAINARVLKSDKPRSLTEIQTEALADVEISLQKALTQTKLPAKRYNALEWAELHPHLAEYEPQAKWEKDPITERQKENLKRFNIDLNTIRGKGHAFQVIGAMYERREKNLATPKQLKILLQFQIPNAKNLTFEEASKAIGMELKRRKELASK